MNSFHSLLITLGIAVSTILILRRLQLPPILGYLITGALVGPYTFGLLSSHEELKTLAEFGVVFLLFTIGLELSLPKLISMRRSLLGLGGMQVILCVAIAVGIAHYAQLSWPTAITIAGALALSSTAVATKLLVEQNELHQEHGKLCLSILLFQDLAAIPFLIIVPSFAIDAVGGEALTDTLLRALVIGTLVVVAMLAIGRWLLRPMFHHIASARSTELFMLSTLLILLVSAFITEHFGLSLALGAFLAGVMLAETEYVHQVEADILPFRDILLGLFFITVGMMLNPQVLIDDWPWVLAIVSGIIIVKLVVISTLAMIAGAAAKPAVRAGLILAQGGEFGFALLAIAYDRAIIDSRINQIIIASIIVSIGIAPLLIRKNRILAKILTGWHTRNHDPEDNQSIAPSDEHTYREHVIICGYGRVGQTLARFLEHEGIPFVGLDIDPLRLQEARAAFEPVFFGNPSDENVLISAGVHRAKLLVLAFNENPELIQKILHNARRLNKDLSILVRTDDDRHLEQLQMAGATEVIPEKLESSLMLVTHMLILLGISPDKARQQVWEVKENRYKMLRGYFPGHLDAMQQHAEEQDKLSLHAVELSEGDYAVGKTLEEFISQKMAIQLASFSRNGYKCESPAPHTILQVGDILVLLAKADEHEIAEDLLLKG